VLFGLIAACGCALDLVTKELVFRWRGAPFPVGPPNHEWWLWEPFIGIETAINPGALFGLGGGYGVVFAALSVIAALAIVIWLFWYRAAADRWLTIALSFVMGGIFGNLYDRLGFWWQPGMPTHWQSGVRDWILFRYQNHTWPNFNIADSLLVCGACMLLVHAFIDRKEAAKSTAAKEVASE